MYRSWAYILMIAATLVGIVALLWPSPQVQTIEEIASVSHDNTPRPEPPPRPAKPVAKSAQAKPKPVAAAPAPPAVLKKMPAPNTTTKRAGPLVQNGLEPQAMFPKPDERPKPGTTPPPRPPLPNHASMPSRSGFGGVPRPSNDSK
jgi:hypothetical protein